MTNTKTAMLELFERFGHLLPNIEKEFLEKEKQQIIHAYEEGQRSEAKQEFWTKGNKYYEETYNKI